MGLVNQQEKMHRRTRKTLSPRETREGGCGKEEKGFSFYPPVVGGRKCNPGVFHVFDAFHSVWLNYSHTKLRKIQEKEAKLQYVHFLQVMISSFCFAGKHATANYPPSPES